MGIDAIFIDQIAGSSLDFQTAASVVNMGVVTRHLIADAAPVSGPAARVAAYARLGPLVFRGPAGIPGVLPRRTLMIHGQMVYFQIVES